MSEKISEYVADATSNPLHPLDLMDLSSFVNPSFPATYDVSKKITLVELTTFLSSLLGNTFYVANGSLTGDRTVSSGGFFTKFEEGDVIVVPQGESGNFGFIVQDNGLNEFGRYSYNSGIGSQGGEFLLTSLNKGQFVKLDSGYAQINCNPAGISVGFGVDRSVALGGFQGLIKTNNVAYVNQLGFSSVGLGGSFDTLVSATFATADRTQTLQDKDGIIALLSDIPAGGGGLYGGSGSLQSGFTTVTMGFFDTLQFLKSGGAGTIVSVSDGTDEAFFGGKIVGVNDITNSKKLQLDSTINGISFIDGNVGGGNQNIIFQEPTSLITHNLTLPVDVSGTVALTSDIPQGLAETIAISNTILDSQQIESVDGKAILQVNNLGVGAFKGTVGVDVVSTLDISDTQAQFFLFSADFSRVGGFGLFANDVLRNFNAGAGDSYPTRISAKGGILNQDVKNSVQVGGNSTIVKTDETAYCNQLAFNTGEAFESLVTYTTPTADRTITLPDADINFETAITETLNFATDSAGQVSTMTFANGVLVSRTLSV